MIDNFRPRVYLKPGEYSDGAEYTYNNNTNLADIINRYVIGEPTSINFVRSNEKTGCKVEDENIWLDFVVNNDGSQTVYYWLPNNTYTLSMEDLNIGLSGADIRQYKQVQLSGMSLSEIKTDYMFGNNNSVTLDFNGASLTQNCDTISIKNVNGEIIGLDDLSVGNVENISFEELSVPYLNLSGWDLSNASSIYTHNVSVDNGIVNLSNITISTDTDYENIVRFGTNITYNLDNWTIANRISLSDMFEGIQDWTGVSINGLNTWDVTDIIYFEDMFSGVELDSLDVSSWDLTNSFCDDTTQVGIHVENMFNNAHIDDLYLNNWIIPYGFSDDHSIVFNNFQGTIHVNGLTFSSPQGSVSYGISYLFYTGCYLIEGLDTWDVSNVVNMKGLFSGFHDVDFDSILEQLEDWNIANITNFDNAFYNIESLTDFSPLDSWRDLIDSNASFENCMYSSETVTDIRYPEWNGWFTPDGTFHPYTQSQYVNGIVFKGIVNGTQPSNPQTGWAITDISTEPNKYLIYNGTSWEDGDTTPPA